MVRHVKVVTLAGILGLCSGLTLPVPELYSVVYNTVTLSFPAPTVSLKEYLLISSFELVTSPQVFNHSLKALQKCTTVISVRKKFDEALKVRW